MRLVEFFSVLSESFLVERDVANANQLKKWAGDVATSMQTAAGKKWMKSQLFQYLINFYDDPHNVHLINTPPADAPEWLRNKIAAGGQIYNVSVSPELEQEVAKVRDYVNSISVAKPDKPIALKFEDALKASGDWHAQLERPTATPQQVDLAAELEGIATIYEFRDGFSWVDVQTAACLGTEGARMQHCVGRGGYTPGIQAGTTKIFSLRDPNNEPHATMETETTEPVVLKRNTDPQWELFPAVDMSGITIQQIKGKQNRAPVPKYVPYVKEFLEWGKFTIGRGIDDLETMNLYLKDDKYLGLEDVSTLFKEYPDGKQWRILSREGLQKYGREEHADAVLVGKDGSKLLSFGLDKPSDPNNIGSIRYAFGNKKQRYYVMDLVNQPGIEAEGSISTLLTNFDIWSNKGKFGELLEVGDIAAKLSSGAKVVTSDNTPENNYILVNKEGALVFSFIIDYAEGDPGKFKILQNVWTNMTILDINLEEMLVEIQQQTGERIDIEKSLPTEPTPEGNASYKSEDGKLLWYKISKERSPVYGFAAFDQYKNPVAIIQTDKDFEEVVSFDNLNSGETTRTGYYLIELITAEGLELGTGLEYDIPNYNWFRDYNDVFYIMDDNFKINYLRVEYREGEEDISDEVETTIANFLSETGLEGATDEGTFYSSIFDEIYKGSYEYEDENQTDEGDWYNITHAATSNDDADQRRHPLERDALDYEEFKRRYSI